VGEILEEHDLSGPDEDRWKTWYRVRRDDGGEVVVVADCTRTTAQTAEALEDDEGMAYVGDRGRAAALLYAEHAQSPATRGRVHIQLALDPFSGGVRASYDYEKPHPPLFEDD